MVEVGQELEGRNSKSVALPQGWQAPNHLRKYCCLNISRMSRMLESGLRMAIKATYFDPGDGVGWWSYLVNQIFAAQ